MCRLYAMHANEPTRVECELVDAQNALMAQSRGDMQGAMHGHGWGVADYSDGVPVIEKQTWAAFKGEHFTKAARRVYARTVVAHVRQATVGAVSRENTHPFHHGRWIFAHNGTLPGFEEVRFRLLEHMDPLYRSEISGQTDSEHVFRYLLSLHLHAPESGLQDTVRRGLERIIAWCAAAAPEGRIGLNVVLTDGHRLVGSRFNRTLFHMRRDHLHVCSICGQSHVHHDPKAPYRSVEVASEPITPEDDWREVPNGTVFAVTPDYALDMVSLRVPA